MTADELEEILVSIKDAVNQIDAKVDRVMRQQKLFEERRTHYCRNFTEELTAIRWRTKVFQDFVEELPRKRGRPRNNLEAKNSAS